MLKQAVIGLSAAIMWWYWPRPNKAVATPKVTTIASNQSRANENKIKVGIEFMNEKTDLDGIFKKHGGITGIPWQLLKAVAMRESSLRPDAMNEEYDGPGGVASRGLMQVLAPQRLNINGWTKNGNTEPVEGIQALYDPDTNVKYGSQILKWNLETFGAKRGIAIYNNYSQRNQPLNGPFSNQGYVDDIINYYEGFGGKLSDLAKYDRGKS